jgi:hypothetical protein
VTVWGPGVAAKTFEVLFYRICELCVVFEAACVVEQRCRPTIIAEFSGLITPRQP